MNRLATMASLHQVSNSLRLFMNSESEPHELVDELARHQPKTDSNNSNRDKYEIPTFMKTLLPLKSSLRGSEL